MSINIPELIIGGMLVILWRRWDFDTEKLILMSGFDLLWRLTESNIINVYFSMHMIFWMSWRNLRDFFVKNLECDSPWNRRWLVLWGNFLVTKCPKLRPKMVLSVEMSPLHNMLKLQSIAQRTFEKELILVGSSKINHHRLVIIVRKLMFLLNSFWRRCISTNH